MNTLLTNLIHFCLIVFQIIYFSDAIGEVLWAVNCGGESHTDVHGIRYQKDNNRDGIASDYGKTLMIQRVVPQDQILYQTERYHTSTLEYEIPIPSDASYVLVLRFSEVWFTSPNQKVFDVVLNGEHTIVEALDIYQKVGRGTAHDEVIPFTVKNNKLKYQEESSDVNNKKVTVEFIKGYRDNPKINAMYLMKGTIEDVPQLPPLAAPDRPEETAAEEEDTTEEETEEDLQRAQSKRKPSGPKVVDPYSADDTGSMMLPVFIAVGAFVPVVFCLCKL